jgi:outer membrane usher protein
MLTGLALLPTSLPGQEKQIPFPLTFNEVSKGEVMAIPNGDDVLVRLSDLEGAGLTSGMWRRVLAFGRLRAGARRVVDGQEYISLRSLAPYVAFKFDEASLALAITASPELLSATRLDVESGPPRDIVYARDKSTFLNYSLTSAPHQRLSAFGELGTSVGGNLLLNSFSRAASGDFVRLLSSYTIDERQNLRRWTVGDASASTDLLGGSVLMGGVTVARNFNLDPYYVRYPPLNFRGTALTPSRIEVYVNGALVSQQEVPPGPFELRNIPVAAGAGNAQIIVRDVFGREQVAGQPYYYSTEVLAQGIREYVYSAGFLRNNFGSSSFDYGDPSVLAFHRIGITDALTAGGRFEASRNLISGGPTVSKRTRFGDINLGAAFSDDRGSTGEAGQFGYQYLAHRFSVGAVARAFTHNYANLSMRREADRPLRDSSAFVTFLASRASVTAQWSVTRMRDTPKTDRVSLLSTFPIGRRTSLFLSVGSANEGLGRKPEVFAGFSLFLGPQTAASITLDHRNGRTQTIAEVQRSLPVGEGFGYRLQSTTDGGQQSGSGVLQYQSSFGRYEMSLDPYHTDIRPTVSAAGGLVYQAGSLLPTRPVEESFALVRVPDVRDVRVYASNVLVGRTNERGDLLVPNLLSYYGNRLSIDDRDIPLNYDVRGVERTIAPPYRGGAFVEFPVRQIRTITGSVVVRNGKSETVPAFGQLTLTGNGEAYVSPIGRNGEFYFENVPAGVYAASVEYREGVCEFRLQVPSSSESVLKLARSVCNVGGTGQ